MIYEKLKEGEIRLLVAENFVEKWKSAGAEGVKSVENPVENGDNHL